MKKRIHIFGASGSGATTIAQGVCDIIKYKHFDVDNYYWLPTEDPFTVERPREECLELMKSDLLNNEQWVLSGSLSGWGETFLPLCELVVFVHVPQEIRIERLEKRERQRYGEAVLPGGVRYQVTKDFLEWAAQYDSGPRNGRSLLKHEKLLQNLKCSVVKLTNDNLGESISAVLENIKQ